MGEKTSKYEGMTAEQIAATLSPRMVSTLATGRDSANSARVHGNTNTVVALIDRGLVQPGADHRWTAIGREVARLVADDLYVGGVEAQRVYTLDELHEMALAESPVPLALTPGDGPVAVPVPASTASKHDAVTVSLIAAELTDPMRSALATGKDYANSSRCRGRRGTLDALHNRGLIAEDRRWTDLGRRVAAKATAGTVYTLDELYKMAIAEGAERAIPDEQIPARVTAFGTIDGKEVPIGQPIETTISRGAAELLSGGLPTERQPEIAVDDIVTVPGVGIGVVTGVNDRRESDAWATVSTSLNLSDRWPVTALQLVPPVAFTALGVPPYAHKLYGGITDEISDRILDSIAGHIDRLAKAARHLAMSGDTRSAYRYAIAQRIEDVRARAERCPNAWHRSAPARTLQSCPECAPTPMTAQTVFKGAVFKIGDRVCFTAGPDLESEWRIDRIYVPARGDEPYAGLSDPSSKSYGTRGTSLRLGLLRHAETRHQKTYGYDPGPTDLNAAGWPVPAVRSRWCPAWQDAHGATLICRREPHDDTVQHEDPKWGLWSADSVPFVPQQSLAVAATHRDATAARADNAMRVAERVQRRALKAVLSVLDGWVEGARSNHAAMDHRGADCCETFAPGDIRRMVDDAARELGVPEPSSE